MPDISPIKVLLVEDHLVTRLALKLTLEAYPNISVCGEAADGRTAVKTACDLRPDVILMDIGLPVMDGLEATRQIMKSLPDARILMITSHESYEDYQAAMASGAAGYCLKDVPGETLIWAISTVLDSAAWGQLGLANSMIRGDFSLPSQAMERLNTNTPVDMSLFQDASGRKAGSALTDLFVSSIKGLLRRAETASKERNVQSFLIITQELKGACASVGADEMTELSREIEQAASDGDWIKIESLCQQLKAAFEHTSNFLQDVTLKGRSN